MKRKYSKTKSNICHLIWISYCPIDSDILKTKAEIPKFELKCINTIIKNSNMDEIWLWSYQKFDDIPGIKFKDANEILDKSYLIDKTAYWCINKKENTGEKMKLAQLADLLRYLILYKYGGWYLDTDIILCKKLPIDEDYIFVTSPNKITGAFASKTPYHITNCAIYIKEINSPIMRNLYEYILNDLKIALDIGSYSNFCRYMTLLEDKINEFKLLEYVKPYQVFCPMPWFCKDLWKKRLLKPRYCYGIKAYSEKEILTHKDGIIGIHLYSCFRTDKEVADSSVNYIFNSF